MLHWKRVLIATCLSLVGGGSPTIALAQIGTVSCTHADTLQYVPAWGQSFINQDGIGRYNLQFFYWNKAQRLAWLRNNSDSTFELDTFFYNYDGQAYGLAPSSPWNTNLPYPYVDTQTSDPEGEKAVTIGTSRAQALQAGVNYCYMIYMTPGPGASSWFKVSAQRGRLVPPGPVCYGNPYCSFGCSASSNFFIIPFPDHVTAPTYGCEEWWVAWPTTGHQLCDWHRNPRPRP